MECEFAEEPPLLEELGINPNRIFEKSLAVLNPFHSNGHFDINLLYETDLAGPAALCIILGTCLLLTGGKANFGYVYGLVIVSCIAMYILLTLMTAEGILPFGSVASVLGYCLLPVVLLSFLGVISSLYSSLGFMCAVLAVMWSSLSASKLFASMSGDAQQRLLIAYPCALLYGRLPPDVSQVHQPILVCTAHIHWDPEFCDVKLIQTMMLSNELRSILEEASHSFRPGHKPDTNNIQLLLCGDFNSLPDSGVIEFLTSGRVPADHKDFKSLAYKSCLQKISGCDKPNEFTHSFKLASAYSEDIMPFTNYTFDFKGIIDYIFYSKQSMTPLGLLGPLATEWLRENKVVGCPHPHVPSGK
ncbi:CCR4-NOT transcription complex subunit 6-like-B [Zootermopsis nevadensis]|uniref:CCR4-NOT transcription complex subunit 6-like-B n=1 Tax=Zootermopsis nevadensis TaxID=136037 RepID=A0A067REK1_ZOONE|nr:CCR4-NOT transcription complex subunit 6-like-B [Zootermopsis nevadensis]